MPCEASGPWDPNVRVDVTFLMVGGFPLKHVFAFSVFEHFLLPKNVHLKKRYFSFQFLSSVSLFQFPSDSFKYLSSFPSSSSSSSVTPQQDEKTSLKSQNSTQEELLFSLVTQQ